MKTNRSRPAAASWRGGRPGAPRFRLLAPARRAARVLAPLAAVVALAPPPAATAGEPPPLTLGEAVARALDHHPAVAAARAGREAAGHRLAETEASRLPLVRATGSAIRYQDPVPATPIHGFGPGQFPEFDDTLFEAALSVEYTVADGGRRAARIRGGEAAAAAAAADLAAAEQAVVARTAATFVRALGLERTLAAHDRRLAALEAERERIDLRRAAGRAADVELRRVEAALAAAGADRVAVAAELATARADLGRLIGGPSGAAVERELAPVALASSELPPAAELLARARSASPEIARAAERLRAAEAAVTVAEAVRRPKLSAVGNLLGFAGLDEPFEDEWNAGLRLAVPLWAAGADRERIAAAEAEREAAAAAVQLAELEAAGWIDRAAAAARREHARAEALERAVTAQAEVVRIEALRLDAGVGVTADYLAAEADLLAASARRTEALQGEIAARVELARLTGELGPGWLATALVAAPAATADAAPTEEVEP